MKMIYPGAGRPPAVVVLDTAEEIALVIDALATFVPAPEQRALADEVYLNLKMEGGPV